jgi:signal transduction histidine kinase
MSDFPTADPGLPPGPEQTRIGELNREMDSLLYALSHDLRAPLRAIDGFSAALAEDFGPSLDQEAQDYIRRVRGAARKLEGYLDALLTLSRESRGEFTPEKTDLSALVREMADRLARDEPHRQVEWAVVQGCMAVTGQALVRTALSKLVDNAWKFTAKTPGARIEFGCEARPGETLFFVADNGVGLDMDYARPRLFGLFQRLNDDPDFPGLGVGLATARRIAGRLGGRLEASGTPGQGARFGIVLPDIGQGGGA